MLAEILKKSFDIYFEAPIQAWEEFAELCKPVRLFCLDSSNRKLSLHTESKYFSAESFSFSRNK